MFIYCNRRLFANQVVLADNFIKRFRGLMGKKHLFSGEGLLLKNCSSVHCYFMHIPIDVVYLSKDMYVLFIETIQPWHIGKFVRKTRHILELPAGFAKDLQVGSKLSLYSTKQDYLE